MAYVMTMAGIRPVFGPTDTDRWMWALAWSEWEDGIFLDEPRLGCIVVTEREGGGHVTLYEETEGNNYLCRGGNQSDMVNVTSIAISSVVALVWPKAAAADLPPIEGRPEMAINRKVLDISHHNEVESWSDIKRAGIVGIIHKATEGTSYTDDTYLERARGALNAGLLWGAYHFANNSNVRDQVEHFLDVVGVDNETLYALDWEEDPDGDTMTLDQAREFLERLEEETGRKGVLYSGNTVKEALGSQEDEFFGEHRMWLAQYSTSPVVQPSWDTYWLWQYSDGNYGPSPHGCPGVSGYVDTNSWAGTDKELRDQWAGVAARPPRPPPGPPGPQPIKPVVVRLVVPENSIVMVNGKVVEPEPVSSKRHD